MLLNLYRNRSYALAKRNADRLVGKSIINKNARRNIINGALRLEAWSGNGFKVDLLEIMNEEDMHKKLLLSQDLALLLDKSSDFYKEFMYISLMIFNFEADKDEFLKFFKKWYDLFNNEIGVLAIIGKIRITDNW